MDGQPGCGEVLQGRSVDQAAQEITGTPTGPRARAARRSRQQGVIHAQSVKATTSIPSASRGHDDDKSINSRNRHIVTDRLKLLPVVAMTTANVGDHETATSLLTRIRELHQNICLVRTDDRHTEPLINWPHKKLALTAEVVKRTDDTKGFAVPPRREVARTLSRLTHPRRVRRDYETPPATRQAMIRSSTITRTGRPLTTWCD
ncbi:transposase [Streptomyces sp. NPDC059881]|uniref:transposase n=1 Tax=Streptomyces sp. NPDC059881 TaxID=3346986 RepID=UPI0036580CCB